MNNQPKDEQAELKVSELAEAIQLRLVAEGILTYERDTPISPQLQAQAAAIQKGIDDYATHIPPATSKSVDELAREVAEKIADHLELQCDDLGIGTLERNAIAAIALPYLADEKGVWDKAIAAVQSVYMTVEPLESPDREHYATWQTAITDAEHALEAARDRSRSGEQSDGVDTWCDDCRGFTHALNCPSKERYPFAEQEKE